MAVDNKVYKLTATVQGAEVVGDWNNRRLGEDYPNLHAGTYFTIQHGAHDWPFKENLEGVSGHPVCTIKVGGRDKYYEVRQDQLESSMEQVAPDPKA